MTESKARELHDENGNRYVLVDDSSLDNFPMLAMRHLLVGGCIQDNDYSNAAYYYWINSKGKLRCVFQHHDGSGRKDHYSGYLSFVEYKMKNWTLIDKPEWLEDL